jgi:hypothetical protein
VIFKVYILKLLWIDMGKKLLLIDDVKLFKWELDGNIIYLDVISKNNDKNKLRNVVNVL